MGQSTCADIHYYTLIYSKMISLSMKKRQTTVTFTSKYEDIRELVLNIVVAFTFATLVVVVIAPLFGYKLDLLVSTFNDLAPQQEDEILGGGPLVDSGYGGY